MKVTESHDSHRESHDSHRGSCSGHMLTLSTSVCVKPAQNHSESGQKGAPSFSEIGEQYIIKT